MGRPAAGGGARLTFSIRPAGKGAPKIDPKPILDGWKLLEATAIYRASGRNVLYGKGDTVSVGQVLLWPKRLLERRVLSDERVEIYACGRDDIKSGQVDRRVLATLEYLAESGLSPTVTSLKSRPRLLHERPATCPSTAPATPWTSPRSTASRSSVTRRRAAWPSRRCAA